MSGQIEMQQCLLLLLRWRIQMLMNRGQILHIHFTSITEICFHLEDGCIVEQLKANV